MCEREIERERECVRKREGVSELCRVLCVRLSQSEKVCLCVFV